MGFRVDQMEQIGISLSLQIDEMTLKLYSKIHYFFNSILNEWTTGMPKMYQKCQKGTKNVLISSRYLTVFVMGSL